MLAAGRGNNKLYWLLVDSSYAIHVQAAAISCPRLMVELLNKPVDYLATVTTSFDAASR